MVPSKELTSHEAVESLKAQFLRDQGKQKPKETRLRENLKKE